MTVPVVGHVTESVAMSPTLDANGWYWFTKQFAVYEGLVELTEPVVGTMTTVAMVLNSGKRVASTSPAAKS